MAKPALGRGLGALLGGVVAPQKPEVLAPISSTPLIPGTELEPVRRVALRQIRPCPFQPRKDFSDESLRELADSIKENGVLQPLIVRARGEGYELIAGERRWRAAQLLGVADVPVLVREADDRTVLELALVENLQRENLNPLEEALGFAQLLEQFQLTQEQAAARVGKSRAAVANALRLLKLPSEVQASLRNGRLSVGHAKVILGLSDPTEQKKLADRVVESGLSVRQTEDLVTGWQKQMSSNLAVEPPSALAPKSDAHVADLEDRLQHRLATKVVLRYREGKGAIEVRFYSDAELQRLLQLLGLELD